MNLQQSIKILANQQLSRTKLISSSLKRTALTAPYWTNVVQTFKYFLATRKNRLSRHPVTWFHYKRLLFGLRPIDWHIMESIVLQQEYALLKQLFSDHTPEIVIDAGANIGLFSVYILAMWPDAEIYAIEASPETYATLKQTQEKNLEYAWHTYQYALWDKNGEVPFESEGLCIAWHISEDNTKAQVPAIRLDSFINNALPQDERISLLKIDIEGAEGSALLACPDVLERVDSVLIEVHPHLCDQKAVTAILWDKFPYVYDVSTPNSYYPLFLSTRWPLSGSKFRLVE